MPTWKRFAMQVNGPPRERRGRPKRTYIEVVTINLKKHNLFEDLAQERSEWRSIIRIADPNIVGTRL